MNLSFEKVSLKTSGYEILGDKEDEKQYWIQLDVENGDIIKKKSPQLSGGIYLLKHPF